MLKPIETSYNLKLIGPMCRNAALCARHVQLLLINYAGGVAEDADVDIQPITRVDFVPAKVFRSRSMNTLPGICPEGLIRVGTSTHTICWTPIGGHRDTSFSRFAYYRIASNETVSLKCQKTGAALRPLNVSVWLTIERINNN